MRWIINLAPFGILGLVYTSVSTSGLEIFTSYGAIILLLVGCMLLIALVVNPHHRLRLHPQEPLPARPALPQGLGYHGVLHP